MSRARAWSSTVRSCGIHHVPSPAPPTDKGADDRSDDSHRRLSGKVFQLDFLFGLEVRQQRFNLSEFDRVSLSRGFHAGYQVFLVGPDKELKVFRGEPRNRVHPAEDVAAECGPTVTDQL
jgi:hypothetical protein